MFERRKEMMICSKALTLHHLEIPKHSFYRDYYDNDSFAKFFDGDLCVVTYGDEPIAFRNATGFYVIDRSPRTDRDVGGRIQN